MISRHEVIPNEVFWKKVRRHRRAKEIAQKDLAPTLGLAQEDLSRREKHGGILPPRSKAIQAAERLELDIEEREELLASAG